MTSFTANMNDLRLALRAAALFASRDPENEMFHRVRVEVGPVNVQVWATNGYAAGLTIASVVDAGDGELDAFDLAPAQVKDILNLFPVNKNLIDDQLLQVQVTGEEHVTVADVSGLFPGKTVELPRLPRREGEGDPVKGVPALLGRTVATTDRHHLDGVIVTNSEWVGLFATAARVYGEPLCLTPYSESVGRGRLLATAGDSFIGALIGQTDQDTDHVREAVEHRDAWTRRLPTATYDPVADLRAALHVVDDDSDEPEEGEHDDD